MNIIMKKVGERHEVVGRVLLTPNVMGDVMYLKKALVRFGKDFINHYGPKAVHLTAGKCCPCGFGEMVAEAVDHGGFRVTVVQVAVGGDR